MYGTGVYTPPGAISFCVQGANLLIAPNEACDVTGVPIAAGQPGLIYYSCCMCFLFIPLDLGLLHSDDYAAHTYIL